MLKTYYFRLLAANDQQLANTTALVHFYCMSFILQKAEYAGSRNGSATIVHADLAIEIAHVRQHCNEKVEPIIS